MVQGGTQALSRSLFASMIPRHKSSEFFAFFGVFERYAGILGPLIFAFVVERTGSGRNAILAVLVFFVVGGAILSFVDVERGRRAAREAEAEAPLQASGRAWRGPACRRPLARARDVRCSTASTASGASRPRRRPAPAEPSQRAARSGGRLGDRRARRPVPREVDAVRRALRADPERRGRDPVYRRLDQGVDTSRNTETFAAVRAALADGDAVCIFPEGISHSTGRLEPLRTGAARMALAAEREGRPRALVAVGLNFDRKTAFRSRVTVALRPAVLGRPISRRTRTIRRRCAPPPSASPTRCAGCSSRPIPSDAALVERVERLYSAARGRPRSPKDASRAGRRSRGIERLRAADRRVRRDRAASCDATTSGCGDSACAIGISTGTCRRGAALALRCGEGAVAIAAAADRHAGLVMFWVPYQLTGSSWRGAHANATSRRPRRSSSAPASTPRGCSSSRSVVAAARGRRRRPGGCPDACRWRSRALRDRA